MGIDPPELARWEDGVEEPPVERLWELSELYRRDVDYFVLSHQGPPSGLSFRVTRRHQLNELSLETRQVIAAFDEFCRAAREVERLLELPRPDPLPSNPELETGEALATAERERLGLGDKPVRDIRKLVEEQGVLCFHLPIPSDEFSGLSWQHSENGACILINGSENPGRRAFTTAHEYAHLLRRDGDSVCDLQTDRGVEHAANRFATAFLMPAADVKETFHRRFGPADLQDIDLSLNVEEIASLARRFGVSLEAMHLRLEELDLVPRRTVDLTGPSKYYGRSRPQWRRRLGETFTNRAFQAHTAGRISAGKLARYLGLDIRQTMDLIQGESTGED